MRETYALWSDPVFEPCRCGASEAPSMSASPSFRTFMTLSVDLGHSTKCRTTN
jgi:hypothetical protein